MATAVATLSRDLPLASAPPPDTAPPATPAPLNPLLPVALAVTAGIMFDRYAGINLTLAALGIVATLLAWLGCGFARRTHLAVLLLWTLAGFLGAAWHHVRHAEYPNDIARYATAEGSLVKLRGVVLEKMTVQPGEYDPLRSRPGAARTIAVLQTTAIWQRDEWRDVRGKTKLSVEATLPAVQVGDEIDLLGTLHRVPGQGNPGGVDTRRRNEDEDIRATVDVKSVDVIGVVQKARIWSLNTWLARVRERGAEVLDLTLSRSTAPVATTLLLGDPSPWRSDRLQGYQRTGVYHALAISGQHLVILCWGLASLKRVFDLSRRMFAVGVMSFVLAYALLTGCQPPVLRAAAMACALCLGAALGRRTQPVNTLALGWLVVALLNPSDLFQTGCQLSFLAVLVFLQVVRPWHHWSMRPRDGLATLIEGERSHWQRFLFGRWSILWWAFLAGLVVWLATLPLLAAEYHLVSPITVLIGPPVVLLAATALFAGFPLLLLGTFAGPLARPFAGLVELALGGCDWLVRLGEGVPGAWWYVSGIPDWWLWSFYGGLLATLLCPALYQRWRIALVVGLVWVGIGLAAESSRPVERELRCTFLAVGKGSCAVLEMPDGRVLLYDAGSLAGPEVTHWQIAPFLWSRGITRIDEVFISHADLDHFNGLPALLDRFPVGQVSLTPSFVDKHQPGVQEVINRLEERGVRVRILSKGQRLDAGGVRMDVLHPPWQGPEGKENARSLVLRVTYLGRTMLLTGDLEQPGLSQVIGSPIPPVDVLMSPHHGSGASNTEKFAEWARAGLIVSSEGRPLRVQVDPYQKLGGILWRTWDEGAVTVRINETGVWAETFRTGQRWRR